MADHEKPPAYNYGAIPPNNPNCQPPPPYADSGAKQPPYQPQPYPTQPYPTQPLAPVSTTTIITQPGVVTMAVVYRELPVSMVCPHCQTHIVTATHYEDGTLTWLLAGGLCLVGCWLGCCLIPFCMDGVKDVIHSCPNCKVRLGVYRRI